MHMSDLFRWRRNPSGTPDKAKETPRPSFSIDKIHPKTIHLLGKVVAFCIDSHSIQMAAVRHWGKSRHLIDIKKEYFPQDKTGRKARQDVIIRTISDFLDKNGGYGTSIALAVSGPETTFRTFLMPRLRGNELDTAVSFEVKKQIPFPFEDCSYDYRLIYSIQKDGAARYKVALQAATTRFIREQCEPFETIGLQVDHVYHTQDVIGELLKYLPDFAEDKNFTLLNIGLKSTEISFYRGTTLEFSHATAVSSAMLGTYPEHTRYEYFSELISNEIQTSLDYYAGQYSVSFNDKIYVYGDLAYSSDLLNMLSSKSGIELEPLPVGSLANLTPRRKDQLDIFPVCMPVLAAAACQSGLANLLPVEQKKTQVQFKTGIYGRMAIALTILIIGLSWIIMKSKASIAEDRLLELNRQVVEFRNSDAFHTYNLVKRQIALDQSYLELIKESPSYLALNLKELSQVTPKQVKLIYLAYEPKPAEKKNLYLHGLVESTDIPPELILAEYVENLSASPFYEEVSIVRHVKKELKEGFQIDFQIQMRGVV